MPNAYIALGSNLEQPLQQVRSAIEHLQQLPNSRLEQVSRLYQNQAIGPGQQPDFINAVALINTELEPIALLDELQAVEQRHKRVRTVHWGPRTLDLDIVLYDQQIIHSERLTVPHPRLQERNFVLYPLHDINSQLTLPSGESLESLLAQCPRGDLTAVADYPVSSDD